MNLVGGGKCLDYVILQTTNVMIIPLTYEVKPSIILDCTRISYGAYVIFSSTLYPGRFTRTKSKLVGFKP